MKNKIQVGKTYKGKYSGVLVVAESVEDKDGWFIGYLKDFPKVYREVTFQSDAFELYDPEFKYPTLFEVVIKYQSLGINIDFDKRGGRNFCFVSRDHNSPLSSLNKSFSYNHNETEQDLVRGILFNAGSFNKEALEEYKTIRDYEEGIKRNVK